MAPLVLLSVDYFLNLGQRISPHQDRTEQILFHDQLDHHQLDFHFIDTILTTSGTLLLILIL